MTNSYELTLINSSPKSFGLIVYSTYTFRYCASKINLSITEIDPYIIHSILGPLIQSSLSLIKSSEPSFYYFYSYVAYGFHLTTDSSHYYLVHLFTSLAYANRALDLVSIKDLHSS